MLIIIYLFDFLILISIIAIGYLVGCLLSIISQSFIELSTFTSLIIVLICILILYLLKDLLETIFVLVFSVIFGAILTIRGLGIYTGSFPDEGYMSTLLYYGEYAKFSSEISLLIVINSLVLSILIVSGLLVQFAILRDSIAENEATEAKEKGLEVKKEDGASEKENDKKEEVVIKDNNN